MHTTKGGGLHPPLPPPSRPPAIHYSGTQLSSVSASEQISGKVLPERQGTANLSPLLRLLINPLCCA